MLPPSCCCSGSTMPNQNVSRRALSWIQWTPSLLLFVSYDMIEWWSLCTTRDCETRKAEGILALSGVAFSGVLACYATWLTLPILPLCLGLLLCSQSARIHNEPLDDGVLHSAAIMTKKDHLSKHVAGTSSRLSRRTNDRVMASPDSSSRRSPIHVLTGKKDL